MTSADRDRPVEFRHRVRPAAGRHRTQDTVERLARRIADDGLHILHANRAPTLRVDDELVDLRPRKRAIGTKARGQHHACVLGDVHLRLP
jgi:hypothetical protein